MTSMFRIPRRRTPCESPQLDVDSPGAPYGRHLVADLVEYQLRARQSRGADIRVTVTGLHPDRVLHDECYRIVVEIRNALLTTAKRGDGSGDDFTCVEEILAILEQRGLGVGMGVHDFG